jgi:hypothetical protein
MGGRFRGGRPAFERELTQRESRVSFPELGDLPKSRRELRQLAGPAQSFYRSQLLVCGTARPDQVRVVGVRQAIRPRARRRHHGPLFEEQDGAVRAGKRERVGNRLDSLRVCDSVPFTVEDAESHPFLTGDTREEVGAVDPSAANLEMRRARAAERTAAEQRSPEVRSTAARSRDHPSWWTVEWRETRSEHTGLVKHLERTVVTGDVQLIPRAPVECVSCVRSDLRHDAERA